MIQSPIESGNEKLAEAAFSKQSIIFDKIYAENTIVAYKRARVRTHILNFLPAESSILELNSGTGDDAIFFAKKGHRVHATDISIGMQAQLKQKAADEGLTNSISTELISFTSLENLKKKEKFDLVFSNFAGLNCSNELDIVLSSFKGLLKPGGVATLVVLPKFCLWEFLLLFKGKFKTALRRPFSFNGARAHVEGVYFKCYYYNPSFIIKHLGKNFELLGIEGLCTIVPPSYMEGFAEKHPQFYHYLKKKEDKFKAVWPWKNIGDYHIISLKKKSTDF